MHFSFDCMLVKTSSHCAALCHCWAQIHDYIRKIYFSYMQLRLILLARQRAEWRQPKRRGFVELGGTSAGGGHVPLPT